MINKNEMHIGCINKTNYAKAIEAERCQSFCREHYVPSPTPPQKCCFKRRLCFIVWEVHFYETKRVFSP